MVTLAERPRSPLLAPFVSLLHYHESEIPVRLERVLPNGRIHLMVNLHEDEFRTYSGACCKTPHRTHGAVLGGPHSEATVIDTKEQRCLVTVDFKLGGAAPFFTTPLEKTRDQLVELDQLWGRDGAVLREKLLEAQTPQLKLDVLETVLLDHLRCAQEPDPAIPYAVSALDHGVRISEVASRAGLLPKTFVRRFRGQVGLTPKRFSRVRRLQRLLRAIGDPADVNWSQLAAEHGYADQAHLIHDFRELTGLTPTSYLPRSAEEHNHVPLG